MKSFQTLSLVLAFAISLHGNEETETTSVVQYYEKLIADQGDIKDSSAVMEFEAMFSASNFEYNLILFSLMVEPTIDFIELLTTNNNHCSTFADHLSQEDLHRIPEIIKDAFKTFPRKQDLWSKSVYLQKNPVVLSTDDFLKNKNLDCYVAGNAILLKRLMELANNDRSGFHACYASFRALALPKSNAVALKLLAEAFITFSAKNQYLKDYSFKCADFPQNKEVGKGFSLDFFYPEYYKIIAHLHDKVQKLYILSELMEDFMKILIQVLISANAKSKMEFVNLAKLQKELPKSLAFVSTSSEKFPHFENLLENGIGVQFVSESKTFSRRDINSNNKKVTIIKQPFENGWLGYEDGLVKSSLDEDPLGGETPSPSKKAKIEGPSQSVVEGHAGPSAPKEAEIKASTQGVVEGHAKAADSCWFPHTKTVFRLALLEAKKWLTVVYEYARVTVKVATHVTANMAFTSIR